MHTGQEVRTTEDGSFEFRDVPRSDLSIRFDAEDVVSKELSLPPTHAGRGIDVKLARLVRFRLTARQDSSGPEAIEVRDAHETPLSITTHYSEGYTGSNSRLTVTNGRSPILSVSDEAAWLILLQQGEVIGRIGLDLRQRDGEVELVY
jgi:hypothetical protein